MRALRWCAGTCAAMLCSLTRLRRATGTRGPAGGPRGSVGHRKRGVRDAGDPATPSGVHQRLPELLFTEVLRIYLKESGDRGLTGWLAALRDPINGPALSLLHTRPAHDWTVAELYLNSRDLQDGADRPLQSALGRTPIHYLTEWRLNLASGLAADHRVRRR